MTLHIYDRKELDRVAIMHFSDIPSASYLGQVTEF